MLFRKNTKKTQARGKTAAKKQKQPAKKLATKSLRIASARVPATCAMPAPDGSRFARYVYLGVILFFVSATFYIMGRSYSILNPENNSAEFMDRAMIDMTGVSPEQRAELASEYFTSGRDKLLAGNIIGAILDLSVSIEADPTAAILFIYRGEAHLKVGDLAKAMADFNQAIALDDGNPVAWYDRALTHIRQENLPAAISDLDVALERNMARPGNVLSNRDIYSRRAQLHLWTENFQAAVNDYTSAIVASAPNSFAGDFAGRAEAYTRLTAYTLAASDYLAAITIISEQIQFAVTAEEREQMSRDAMTYFEKSAALNVMTSDFIMARTDLESALTIASALQDSDAINRLQTLLNGM
jgi:tetratricopeptide (TPR) repeat protein